MTRAETKVRPTPEQTGEPAKVITVRGLVKRYPGADAVRGIDLDVSLGEVFAFLGPNGAGKTTTVEILEGFRSRTAGEVTVLGTDPAKAGSAWRDRVGIVLQESSPDTGLTVSECLSLYAGYYSRPRDVEETIALVGLEEQKDTLSERLSGGQRRRLDVGLALVGDPQLLFLDEPTTGFDPSARRGAWAMVDGLRDLGKTIFLTTHYMEEAERLADRIAVIVAGEIVAEGTPRTLGGRDRADARIVFTPPARADLGGLALGHRLKRARDGRVEIRSGLPIADLEALIAFARRNDVDLTDLEISRPTLEDVYLELTGETG